MSLHPFLRSQMKLAESLLHDLLKYYSYVSILGTYTAHKRFLVGSFLTTVDETEKNCGFVIRIYQEGHYSEYSANDLTGLTADEVSRRITVNLENTKVVNSALLEEEEITKSFIRLDEHPLADEAILKRLQIIKDKVASYDERLVNVNAFFGKREESRFFLSKKKRLDQYYSWNNSAIEVTSREGDIIKSAYETENEVDSLLTLDKLEEHCEKAAKHAIDLLSAEAIEPGEYEIITHPSITGLIAHEAFGHGVEMDMYVKHRARSRYFMNQPVASSLVNMHDGAAATLSAASYFFDDDGVLAQDTLIIEKGILRSGISDMISASELGKKPTGNGRRESFSHKSYTRMTNTFFAPGKDKLEDMIASVKHGYYLCDTDNGMEDPKNWQIQCTAAYGLEIKDGKFTGKIVAPVVISGYVLDLLKSISMVSDEWKIIGSGMCGKGYKEWVFVSDGGPYMKAKAKLA